MPRLTRPLSDTEIKNAKFTTDEEFKKIKEINHNAKKNNKLSDGEGLYLVIKSNGRKFFQFDYTFKGKRKSMSFGVYPTVSLKKARELRDYNKKLLLEEIDPVVNKKTVDKITTFETVLNNWIHIVKVEWKSETTYNRNTNILNVYVNKHLKDIEFKEINRNHIIKIFDNLVQKGYLETANKIYGLISRLWKYASTYNFCEHNIIADIDKKALIPKQNVVHRAAITNTKDLKQLLFDINEYENLFNADISSIYALKLAPYVALRPFNLRTLEWSEVNFEKMLLDIPAEKMKTNKDFILPISEQAIKLIKEIEPYSAHKSKYVFPSPISTAKPISDANLSHALARLGYKNKQTPHGFRSTFSTIAHENISNHGIYSDIIESCLAHEEKNKIKAAYNRSSKMKYFEEKKELMQWWADCLDTLLNDSKI